MKHVLFTLLAFGAIAAQAQIIDELPKDDQGRLNFSEVVQVDSVPKTQLHARAKEFFANTFRSAKDVIQLDDKETGTVIGKGFSPFPIKSGGMQISFEMWYTIKIQCKDGRYKAEMYDISYRSDMTENYAETFFDKKNYYKKNGEPIGMAEQYKVNTVQKANEMFDAIQEAMKKASTSSKNDW